MNIEQTICDRIKLACTAETSFNSIAEIAKPILIDCVKELELDIDTDYALSEIYDDRCIIEVGGWPKFGNGICFIAYYPPQKIDDINSTYSITDKIIYEIHMSEH